MKKIALIGNPNCGKTTLFNLLTGSTAYVGNWPGVTVDKKEGVYKHLEENLDIVDLPGIYSLSPYTDEEIISRNFLLEEKPDCVINIVDATNLERNLYLTTQLLEIDVPVVIALNMIDEVKKVGDKIDTKSLEKSIGVPVLEISALKNKGINELMNSVYSQSKKKRNGTTILKESKLINLIEIIKNKLIDEKIDNPLFHAIKIVEQDEFECKNHKELIHIVEDYKKSINDQTFSDDLEALIADTRYKYISNNFSIALVKNKNRGELNTSDKVDKILTNKWAGIPIFLLIMFLIFHLTFSENLFFLGGLFKNVSPSFEGSIFEGLIWTRRGINSPGVFFANLLGTLTDSISSLVEGWMVNTSPWLSGLVVQGILGGLFSVLSFLPQILILFLFFSILEDSGYMARVAFILDRIFRKFGLSGRSFLPMIMGFGCSVPAMINCRTLADDNEKVATIRVIPFFSCGAKLPILTAIAGGIVSAFNFPNPDIITYSMYVCGMVIAIVCIIIMRKTKLKGDVPPFIMELPTYHLPKFNSLMIHLWDKLKHFLKKAFTIILASTIIIWFLSNFGWNWHYVGSEEMDQSILASLGKLIQPIFTPLGFGAQLTAVGWVFAVAAMTGLVAKENVVGTFFTLAVCIISAANAGSISPDIIAAINGAQEASEDGVVEAVAMIQATGITWPGLISFIIFNMTTIPCFAAVATAKAELPKQEFGSTILFWLVVSYFVGTIVYLFLLPFYNIIYWWTWLIVTLLIASIVAYIYLYNFKKRNVRE